MKIFTKVCEALLNTKLQPQPSYLTTNVSLPSDIYPAPGLPLLFAILSVGFLFPWAGLLGRFAGFGLLAVISWRLLRLKMRSEQTTYRFFYLLGLLIGGQVFFRDFVMNNLTGYLIVEYFLLFLGLINLPTLLRSIGSPGYRGIILSWLGFCIWMVIGLTLSLDILRGRWFIILYWSGLSMMLLALAYGIEQHSIIGLIDGLVSGCVLTLGCGLYFHLTSPEIFREATGQRFAHALVSAVQFSTMLSAGMLLTLVRFVLYKNFSMSMLVVMLSFGIASIATFSRGPLLALLIAAAIITLQSKGVNRKFKLLFIFALVGGLSAFFLREYFPEQMRSRYINIQIDREREGIWEVSNEMWQMKPLIGWGTGSWPTVYPQFSFLSIHAPPVVSDAHNMIVHIAVEHGLVGVVLLGISVAMMFMKVFTSRSMVALGILTYTVLIGLSANWKIPIIYTLIALALLSMRHVNADQPARDSYDKSQYRFVNLTSAKRH